MTIIRIKEGVTLVIFENGNRVVIENEKELEVIKKWAA